MIKRIKKYVAGRLYQAVSNYEQTEYARKVEGWLSNMKAVGENVCLNGRASMTGIESIEIGDNVHIGDNAFIRAEGGLTIGDNTHISRNLVLYTVNHNIHGARLPYDEEQICRPVVIGRNVWIGMNVCIAPGTVIGDGAVIGLGTVVSGEVPSQCIVVNGKSRVVGYRDSDHYNRCELERAYGGANGAILSIKMTDQTEGRYD